MKLFCTWASVKVVRFRYLEQTTKPELPKWTIWEVFKEQQRLWNFECKVMEDTKTKWIKYGHLRRFRKMIYQNQIGSSGKNFSILWPAQMLRQCHSTPDISWITFLGFHLLYIGNSFLLAHVTLLLDYLQNNVMNILSHATSITAKWGKKIRNCKHQKAETEQSIKMKLTRIHKHVRYSLQEHARFHLNFLEACVWHTLSEPDLLRKQCEAAKDENSLNFGTKRYETDGIALDNQREKFTFSTSFLT